MNRHSPEKTSWALSAALRRLWGETKLGAARLQSGAWGRWWLAIIVGFVICSVLSWGLALNARALAPRGLDDWDARTLRWIEQDGLISFQNAILIESPGNLAYLIPVTLAAAVIAILKHRPIFTASIVASYVLMRLIVLVGWMTWDRPRPQLILGGAASPPLHSFPSGHIALAISVYGLLAYVWFERSRNRLERILIILLTLAFCGIVGMARVRLGTHWPSDVVGGAILGVAWVLFVILALRPAERSGQRELSYNPVENRAEPNEA